MGYRPRDQRPPEVVLPRDIVEFRRVDAWVSTRYALKPRGYQYTLAGPPPEYPEVVRFKLETLTPAFVWRLRVFCQEQGIAARFLTRYGARKAPWEGAQG